MPQGGERGGEGGGGGVEGRIAHEICRKEEREKDLKMVENYTDI
jgi:hypothetical protein